MRRALPGWLLALLLLAIGTTTAVHAARQEPLRGQLLVATHQEDHTAFAHTVILVIRAGQAGAYGVVINRPTDTPLADLLPHETRPSNVDFNVYVGGPVGLNRLSLLARGQFSGGQIDQVLPQVAYTASAAAFDKLLDDEPDPENVRILVGYAGWGPHQLESEIARGAWDVQKATVDKVFSGDPAKIWQRLHHGTGKTGPKAAPLHSI